MKRRLFAAFAFTAALGGLPLAAQQTPPPPQPTPQDLLKPFTPDDGKPVLRATPVHPVRPLPTDPVDNSDGAAATPIPKPVPVRRAKPVKATPEAAPQPAHSAAPPVSPEPSDPGEIRIAPQTGTRQPDQVQMDVADSYFARKMYDMAAPEYQRYTELYPGQPDMEAALFRLAQCYRKTGSLNAAKTTYEMLLDRFQNGDFIGPAAYFLAELYYQEKNYTMALPLYRKASVRLKEPGIINAAKFFTARCSEAEGEKLEARAIYEELSEIKDNNLFRDASRLSYALLLKESPAGATEALKQIQTLLKQTDNADLQAQAAVEAGVWELEAGQTERAGADLRKALEMPNIGRWREVAELGLVQMYFDTGKYQQVLDSYAHFGDAQPTPGQPAPLQFSSETKPKLLLLVANADRQLKKFPEALLGYDQLLKEYAGTPSAKEAGYDRLVSLYEAADPRLPAEIDAFLAGNPEGEKRDQALLMKAEGFYKKQDYKNAAPIYELVTNSVHLTGLLKGEALFKFGWCSMQERDFDKAIKAFTKFIDEYPVSKSLPYAYIQRALAYQAQKNLTAAEKDFDLIIHKYPAAAKERELALQQKALIRGQENDNAGMAENFEQLLKDYPKTPAAADAHFWIGTAAFGAKDYKKAALNLAQARELDKAQYFERTTLLIVTANYYLEDKQSLGSEIELYRKSGKSKVPIEILHWLSEQLIKDGDLPNAKKYLEMIIPREEAQPKDFLLLGETLLKLDQDKEAAGMLQTYLTKVQEPPSRALGLIELAKAQIGEKEFEAAQKSVDETLTLQPEGKISGEARIIAGDIEYARENFEAAAKLYLSVSVILDDDEITPRALEKAVDAYRKAGLQAEAKKTLNTLQSRYPEYFQQNRLAK